MTYTLVHILLSTQTKAYKACSLKYASQDYFIVFEADSLCHPPPTKKGNFQAYTLFQHIFVRWKKLCRTIHATSCTLQPHKSDYNLINVTLQVLYFTM